MGRSFTAVVVLLSALVVAAASQARADSTEFICDDPLVWHKTLVPIEIVELACTIQEVGDPVSVVQVDETFVEGEPQEPDALYGGLSEGTREQLLLLLTLWSSE